METVENVILEDINELRDKLEDMEPGSKEYEATAKRLDALMDKAIKMGEFNIEQNIKLQQMDEDRKDKLVKNILAAAGIVLPVGATIWGTLKSLKFEETGTVTTIMGRGFINKLLPKK